MKNVDKILILIVAAVIGMMLWTEGVISIPEFKSAPVEIDGLPGVHQGDTIHSRVDHHLLTILESKDSMVQVGWTEKKPQYGSLGSVKGHKEMSGSKWVEKATIRKSSYTVVACPHQD